MVQFQPRGACGFVLADQEGAALPACETLEESLETAAQRAVIFIESRRTQDCPLRARKQLSCRRHRPFKEVRRSADATLFLEEKLAGKLHPLSGTRAGQLARNLVGGRRLVFEPADLPIPRSEDGGIAWRRVTRIRIVYIGDYHD